MTHTPGPWLMAEGFNGATPRIFIMDSRPTDPHDPESEGPIIAELWDAEPSVLASDARLIAAAPELLEALQLAEATVERLDKVGSAVGTLDVIRAAIAKAIDGGVS